MLSPPLESAGQRTLLRVGLILDSFLQPAWIIKIIQDIQSSDVAKIALVIKLEEASQSHWPAQIGRQPQNLLYQAYCKFDEQRNKTEKDAFKISSGESLLSECPVIKAEKAGPDRTDHDSLDVALYFGSKSLRGNLLKIAKHGVWAYGMSRAEPFTGVWEVLKETPVTTSTLEILAEEPAQRKVIYRSYSSSNPFSVWKSRNHVYWKSSNFVMRQLKRLCQEGPESLKESASEPSHSELDRPPKRFEMAKCLFALTGRYVKYHLDKLYSIEQWFLAYRFNPQPLNSQNALSGLKVFMPPQDRFWADPFPVKHGDRYFIFFEEYLYEEKKGHIAVVEVDPYGRQGEVRIALERDYHLAYPFIFRWKNDYYMIPETSQKRSVELFRCISFPTKWQFEKTLLSNLQAVDATLAEINGLWWMFVSIASEGVTKNWDELSLFYAETPFGPWYPHEQNPVKSDVRQSRPAGRLFAWNGDMYRPAQDCSKRYGYAISLNKIIRLNTEEYLEIEVSKMLPKWHKKLLGTHTLNQEEYLTVTDGLIRRNIFF